MRNCVVPVQAITRVSSWIVWQRARGGGCRGGECPVHAAVVLGVGQGYSRRSVILRVVLLLGLLLLLLLRLVAVAAVVAARGGRRRPWGHLRRAGAPDEQLVVLALRIAVAAGGRVAVAGSTAVRLVAIIGSVVVLVLILDGDSQG